LFPSSHWHATTQRFVNGDQSGDGARLAGSQAVLRFKERAFGIEHAEKIRYSAFVTLMREVRSFLAGFSRGLQKLLSRLLLSEVH